MSREWSADLTAADTGEREVLAPGERGEFPVRGDMRAVESTGDLRATRCRFGNRTAAESSLLFD